MAAERKQENHTDADGKKKKRLFSKEQITASEKYRKERDLVSALLEEGTSYTFETVDSMIEKYKKGKVK